MDIITLKNILCQTPERVILSDINIKFSQKSTAIIGANGSGKSTLVRLLNGLILPDKGEVWVGDYKTESRNLTKIRKHIGFMFQNPAHQIIWPQVKEDLTFSLKTHGYSKDIYDNRIDHILSQLNILHLKNALAHELSGGECQLVALAALLITEPNWLIFDEPTTMLDLYNILNIKKIIQNLKQKVIVITHDLNWARQFDHILWINEGRIEASGGAEVVEHYQNYIYDRLNKDAL